MAANSRSKDTRDLRVALLTNSLSPHTLPLCEGIRVRVGELCAFVSAASDTFHNFPHPEGSFRIIVQRSCNVLHLRHRTKDFSVVEDLHLPWDTLPQLFRYGPDVIVTSQFGARTLFAIAYRMLRPRVRLILWAALSTHTEQERSGFRTALRRWMVRWGDAAFANGQSGEAYLRRLGFSEKVSTIPYTIDDTLFLRETAYDPQEDERRLLFCGRLDATKGILGFCEVLHRWCTDHPERRVEMKLIGNGPHAEAIRALAPLPNLDLCLLPRMEQRELAVHYHQTDIFAFPSLLDEWGVVVNEAMSAGLPVLGSCRSQAVAELVREGESGWIFEARSEADTYQALDRALTASAAQLKERSVQARRAVAAIDPGTIAGRAVQAMAEVCGFTGEAQGSRRAELATGSAQAASLP